MIENGICFSSPQLANVAPLIYTLASWRYPHQSFETPVIYTIIAMGAMACLLLAFLWDVTSEIAGTQHSTALLILQFFLALVDCTSSVAFLPFMFTLKAQYMTAYFIGEGFSGLIPSLVALGQGAGSMECVTVMASSASGGNDSQIEQTFSKFYNNNTNKGLLESSEFNFSYPIAMQRSTESTESPVLYVYPKYQEPRFSVSTFFFILMIFLIFSNISFTLLKYWSYCKREYNSQGIEVVGDSSELAMLEKVEDLLPNDCRSTKSAALSEFNCKTVNELEKYLESQKNKKKNANVYNFELLESKKPSPETEQLNCSQSSGAFEEESSSSTSFCEKPKMEMSKAKLILFLILTAWLNAVSNGVLPSIQTYSCLPYGIKPYHLSVTLAAIANPVACFAASLITISSIFSTLVMTALGSTLAGYIVFTAAASPNPPLVGMMAGTTVLVLCWILVVFVLTYSKVCIASTFREEGQGRKALLWVGAFTQMGSLAGALVAFLLINVYKVFTQGNPCLI
ncbi:solute carrier family 52, riboflavin transporter, member 3 [Elysia marginata]|uniref:Riboflavin transporter n=1 Tax=Elysia marginata TaxID=1093978 RepID=A0AAV4I336_9GAST|nr:solute carrier family 52, riboflavin transporter, member 3 [Elysia marginata]